MESIKSAFDYRFIRNLQTMDLYAVEGFAGYLKGGRTMSLYKGPKYRMLSRLRLIREQKSSFSGSTGVTHGWAEEMRSGDVTQKSKL